jgi:hypothetical protein
MPGGKSRWIVEYRPGARGRGVAKKRLVIGDGATVKVEEAREKARTILAAVQLGDDPARERSEERKSLTGRELVGKYIDQHIVVKRKPKTVEFFKYLLRNHISPGLGSKRASSLTRQEVARWHREIGLSGRTTVANRALVVLSAAVNFGVRYGYLNEDFQNPTKGIEKFLEISRERYLSGAESFSGSTRLATWS